MNILIIGNGGREHALTWKIAQSSQVEKIYVAPGNAGTMLEPKTENVDIAATDIHALLHFAQYNHINLTIVGPEVPLALGIVDLFQQAKLPCFGPTKAAAQLESSKSFSKTFMREHNIPTANSATFTHVLEAKTYVMTQQLPIVIKADGLAAGKGVVIAETFTKANTAIEDMLAANKFGEAGSKIIIEEYLQGEEVSFIAIVSGEQILPLASSQDHKRLNDADSGPNTGGMGAYSPAPIITTTLQQQIMNQVMLPTAKGMIAAGQPYTGFLYAGLMISESGKINVLEFNCRLGDPETQCILPRLESDLVELCQAALENRLADKKINWSNDAAVAVVLANKGYPDTCPQGDIISGLDNITDEHCKVFHAGSQIVNKHVIATGGRVLTVTARGNTIQQAQQNAYNQVRRITWKNCYYRQDIGYKAIKQQTK